MKSMNEKARPCGEQEIPAPQSRKTRFTAECSERGRWLAGLSIALLTLIGALFSMLAQRESSARRDENEVARMSRFSSFRCFRVLDI